MCYFIEALRWLQKLLNQQEMITTWKAVAEYDSKQSSGVYSIKRIACGGTKLGMVLPFMALTGMWT